MGKRERQPHTAVRLETDHGRVIEEEVLVERGPDHPLGPGVDHFSTYRSKERKRA